MTAFHEIQFPPNISLGSTGGPERRTEIVTLGSGYEERNQRWADSRRTYQAGLGIKSLDDVHAALQFFEERRGRLTGFRWKDWADFKSCSPMHSATAFDQVIGTGTGAQTVWQLTKLYGATYAPWVRTIAKPVPGTVRIGVAGVEKTSGWTIDTATGLVTFATAPASGAAITAGFEFDVPARFDTDKFIINVEEFGLGSISQLPVIEIRLS